MTFSPDDSQFVSYKTWEVLQPSTDTADCRVRPRPTDCLPGRLLSPAC